MTSHYLRNVPLNYQSKATAVPDMNTPCWDVVGWSKRGLSHEKRALETPSLAIEEPKHLDRPSVQLGFFRRLPGELRNNILELCVNDATFCPRCLEHHEIVADISRNMQIRGIGHLSLLFVNEALHAELVSLVYSKLAPVAIDGYFLKFHEKTSFRPFYYSAIWPHHQRVQSFARKVSITMHYWKMWGEGEGAWCNFTSDRQLSTDSTFETDKPRDWEGDEDMNAGTPFERSRWVIRKLTTYLRTFKSLSELEITIELRTHAKGWDEVYGLEQLLPLYDLGVPRTTFKFDMRDMRDGVTANMTTPKEEDQQGPKRYVRKWMLAWMECLVGNGRKWIEFESGAEKRESVVAFSSVVAGQTTYSKLPAK